MPCMITRSLDRNNNIVLLLMQVIQLGL